MPMPRKSTINTYQEVPLKVKAVRLPFVLIRRAIKIGKGCFSTGIRKALEEYREPPLTKED